MTLNATPRAVALAAAAFVALQASHAQTSPAPAPAAAAQAEPQKSAEPAEAPKSDGGLNLERIVVTGTTTARTKMKQSVSVSTLDADQVQNAVAASATEVLRAVPGIRAESTGGEGNANLGVRGLPMSDGGGRYVQLQEDGLPVLLVGDVSFATADQFLRADYSLDSIDTIRGGSSSTLSTNSPGAIVNFLSKTGKHGGGAIGMSLGLDHRQQRADFDFGTRLGDKLYGHVGGFYRIGEGARPSNVTLENGGQIKASITKEFDNGYLRVNFKHLDDRTPTYLPVPVSLDGNTITELQGVDPRTAFFVNSNFPQDVVVDRNGNRLATNPADGLAVKVDSIGVEAHFKFAGDLSITNRFRKSAISGRFIGVFPAGSQPPTSTSTTPYFSAHIFNTALDDMGNVFNDLRVQKAFTLGEASKLTATGGLFSGVQRFAQTWYWNRYNFELKGEGARIVDDNGAPTTQPVGDATTTWGGCCYRSFDVDLTAVAPYAALTWDQGPLSVDASVRYDKQRASGWQIFGGAAGWDPTRRNTVSYATDGTSYSVGANYEFQRNLAAFARASHGISWKSPDRVIWDTRVATGVDPYPVNEVDQIEAGLKFRQGSLNAFVTAFFAKTKEGAGFEVTTQTVKQDSYDSKGLEAELSYRIGDFRVIGGATFTHARITSGPNNGKVPRRQADLIYQIAPSYTFGPLEVGGSVIGTTKSYAQNDNQVVLPAYTVVNAFANYELRDNLVLQLGVNNLFDTLGYTEAEAQNNLGNNPLYIARAVNGRTAKLSLKYTF
ncbi:MAG: TonB-dependent receptor [Pseudomonadota bacterium]